MNIIDTDNITSPPFFAVDFFAVDSMYDIAVQRSFYAILTKLQKVLEICKEL